MKRVEDRMDEKEQVRCEYRNATFYISTQLFSRLVMRTRIPDKKYCRLKEGAELFAMSEKDFRMLAYQARAVFTKDKTVLVRIADIDEYLSRCEDELENDSCILLMDAINSCALSSKVIK